MLCSNCFVKFNLYLCVDAQFFCAAFAKLFITCVKLLMELLDHFGGIVVEEDIATHVQLVVPEQVIGQISWNFASSIFIWRLIHEYELKPEQIPGPLAQGSRE